MGSKYLEYNPGLELNIFSWITNNEQKNHMKTKVEQNESKSNNNKKIMNNNWYKNTIHKIIHECWNVTIQSLHKVKIKRITFRAYNWSKKRAKSSSKLKYWKGKSQPAKEKHYGWKKKDVYSRLQNL
jgi:hypothetical protein